MLRSVIPSWKIAPHCGLSMKEIEKRSTKGESKTASHKDMLERLRRAGLPTRV